MERCSPCPHGAGTPWPAGHSLGQTTKEEKVQIEAWWAQRKLTWEEIKYGGQTCVLRKNGLEAQIKI